MPVRARICCAAILMLALVPACGQADEIDTEHLFGFMIGSDVGNVGEREFQSQTTGRFSRSGGSYRALTQELELEFVPAKDFRVELGSSFASHDISGVAGFEDRRQLGWQGLSVDLRYRFLDRNHAPFGLTFAVETNANHIDQGRGLPARSYGTEFTLAFDRELIPDYLVAAINLLYQPEWTRLVGTDAVEREAAVGVAAALMTQIRPGLYLGGEARYLRTYEGIGLQEFAGDALFVGPTAYFKLSERSRLTAAWSMQAWGHAAGSAGTLNLVGFERHQARLIYGINF
jgi:hypothetical protein